MLNGIEINQIYLFVILVGAVILLFTEWIRIDLTAVLIIVALGLTGVLEPEAALSGFSSEPAILLATVFVLNGALYHTGLSGRLGTERVALEPEGGGKRLLPPAAQRLVVALAGMSPDANRVAGSPQR